MKIKDYKNCLTTLIDDMCVQEYILQIHKKKEYILQAWVWMLLCKNQQLEHTNLFDVLAMFCLLFQRTCDYVVMVRASPAELVKLET
jgi:hypothetical protein